MLAMKLVISAHLEDICLGVALRRGGAVATEVSKQKNGVDRRGSNERLGRGLGPAFLVVKRCAKTYQQPAQVQLSQWCLHEEVRGNR